MKPKEIKNLVAKAVKEYVRISESENEDSQANPWKLARAFVHQLLNAAGVPAGVQFVDKLQDIGKKKEFVIELFAHDALITELAKRGDIPNARKEATRYKDGDEGASQVARSYITLAEARPEPEHIARAFEAILEMERDTEQVQLLFLMARRFEDQNEAAEAATTIAFEIIKQGRPIQVALAYIELAQYTTEPPFWLKAIEAASKCAKGIERTTAFEAVVQSLLQGAGAERAKLLARELPQTEFRERLQQRLNRSDPNLN